MKITAAQVPVEHSKLLHNLNALMMFHHFGKIEWQIKIPNRSQMSQEENYLQNHFPA